MPLAYSPPFVVEAFRFVGDLSDIAAFFVEDVDYFVAGVKDVEIVGRLVDGDPEGAVVTPWTARTIPAGVSKPASWPLAAGVGVAEAW